MLGLANILGPQLLDAAAAEDSFDNTPLAPNRRISRPGEAGHSLFANGGPSHVDTSIQAGAGAIARKTAADG